MKSRGTFTSDLRFIDLLVKCWFSSRARLDLASTFSPSVEPYILNRLYLLFTLCLQSYSSAFYCSLVFSSASRVIVSSSDSIDFLSLIISSRQQSLTTKIFKTSPNFLPISLNLSSAGQNIFLLSSSFSTKYCFPFEQPCPA